MLNITLSVFLIVALFLIYEGFRNGLVSKAISFVILFILGLVFVVAAVFLNAYLSGSTMNVIVGAILFVLLLTLHRVLSVLYVNTKLAKKLGEPNVLFRILGAVLGICEAVLILWTVYGIMGALSMGEVAARVEMETVNTPVLKQLYDFNLLEMIVRALPIA